MSELRLLVRAERWVVVAKPPRMLVHRNALAPKADAVLQRLRNQLRRHVYPVHRLDHAASGCLLFALDREATAMLQAAMQGDGARKRYLAFVRGQWRREGPVVVENPLIDDNGNLKDARSVVDCLGASLEPRCSLLVVEPKTGRFHQVRRHVRDLDHPIVGDTKHGDSRVNRWWRETEGFGRLGLHALSLDVPLPDGTTLSATCPLFDDMAAVMRRMPWWADAVARCPELAADPLPLPPDPLAPPPDPLASTTEAEEDPTADEGPPAEERP